MIAEMTIPFIANFSYLAILVVVLLNGSGFLPIPEEILLLVTGYLVFDRMFHFWPAVFIALIGVIIVDNVHFYFASHGHCILKRFVNRKLLERVQKAVDAHGPFAVFFARFIPSTRVITAWVAGTSGMRQRKFFFADLAGAIIQTPLFVWIGFKLGAHAGKAIRIAHSVDAIVPLVLLIFLVLFAIIVCLFRTTIRNFILEACRRD